jgi:hypothetical protein
MPCRRGDLRFQRLPPTHGRTTPPLLVQRQSTAGARGVSRAIEPSPCTNPPSLRGGLVTGQQVYSLPPVLIRHRSGMPRSVCNGPDAANAYLTPKGYKAAQEGFQESLSAFLDSLPSAWSFI